MMKINRFKKLNQAKAKQRQMKKLYGYKPTIFKVTGKGKQDMLLLNQEVWLDYETHNQHE